MAASPLLSTKEIRDIERAHKSHLHTFGCYRDWSGHRTPAGVVLDGKRSYLKSSPLLDRLGVRVHVALRCFLCVECGRAFIPKSMATHLAQRHNICTSDDDRKALLDFSRANSVGDQPWDGPLPKNYRPPVELVSQQAGFACGVGEHSKWFLNFGQQFLIYLPVGWRRPVPLCFWVPVHHHRSPQEGAPSCDTKGSHTHFSSAPVPGRNTSSLAPPWGTILLRAYFPILSQTFFPRCLSFSLRFL